jgi:hypothetical protein
MRADRLSYFGSGLCCSTRPPAGLRRSPIVARCLVLDAVRCATVETFCYFLCHEYFAPFVISQHAICGGRRSDSELDAQALLKQREPV